MIDIEIGIISDTHLDPKADYSKLYNKLLKIFADVELIIHAGDVTNEKFLNDLRNIAPVEAVCGDMDDTTIRNKYDNFKILEFINIKVGVSHQLPTINFVKREKLKIMVYGHTHAPEIHENPGILLLNPGSPTYPSSPSVRKMYRKRPPLPSVIILCIEPEISSAYIVSFKLT